MANSIHIGGGGGSTPTLIAKSITQNGTYNAIDDNADGYSSVDVDVAGIGDVIMLTSNNPFIQNTGITGTNVANVARSWTFAEAGVIKFSPTTYGRTNTGSNEGFYDIQLNGVSVVKQYLTTGVDTTITVSDIPVSVGDTLDIVYGFDNYHSRCDFTIYTAIVLVTGGGSGIDYLESWIINSKSSVDIPTTTTHIEYTNGEISGFNVADNAGNETVTMGDITTFIGNASSFYWWVTANANMTYRIYNVLTGTLGALQTAQSGDRIISDGDIDVPYCMEIRRYS